MYFVINSGSSSLKFKVFDGRLVELGGGIVERIGLSGPFLEMKAGGRRLRLDAAAQAGDHKAALRLVFEALAENRIDADDFSAIGHRVVHGGEDLTEPAVIAPAVLKKLEAVSALAPLHNPANLAGIAACRLLLKAPNVAVFDTAFYRTIPASAFMYALPWEFYEKHGIRKYGFHGISHQYVSEEAARLIKRPLAKLRLVTCHLGGGSSVTAVAAGRALDTSMGFTPLEGLTMSTRCGDIDPAVPLYMIRTLKMTAAEVDETLNFKSGLLGVAGEKDMRDVLALAGVKGSRGRGVEGASGQRRVSPEARRRARLAVEMFCYDAARYIAQYAGIMKGCDAVVFTAGIGERSAYIRKRIMGMVALPGKPKSLVIPTNEELAIAREVRRVVG